MDITNFKMYQGFLDFLLQIIGRASEKNMTVIPIYMYLYELTLCQILEELGGDPQLVNFFRNNSHKIIKDYTLEYYVDEQGLRSEECNEPLDDDSKAIKEHINKLNEEIKRAKEVTEGFKVPETFKDFIKLCKDTGTVPNVEVPEKEGDRQIDAYLKNKKKNKAKKKKNTKGKK